MGSTSGPVLKGRFEKGVVDVVSVVPTGGGRRVRSEEKREGLKHGAAAGVAAQECVGGVEIA